MISIRTHTVDSIQELEMKEYKRGIKVISFKFSIKGLSINNIQLFQSRTFKKSISFISFSESISLKIFLPMNIVEFKKLIKL